MVFYDFEVFRHDWVVVALDMDNKQEHVIHNDPDKLQSLYEAHKTDIWVGYNNARYDNWIFTGILTGFDPYDISKWIVKDKKPAYQYSRTLNGVELISFDVCMVGDGGLKSLEGFMGYDIRETSVDFDIDRQLTESELERTVQYCRHDVEQTVQVFLHRKAEFEAQIALIKAFKLPLSYLSKTKPQLTALILGAQRTTYSDEFDIKIPSTCIIEKYRHVVDWYKNPDNMDYDSSLTTTVAGVEHQFRWGGLHGARDQHFGKGYYVNIDVESYYPALMIEYDYLSRSVYDKARYRNIRDERLKLKAEKSPMQQPYKIVLNSTYGAMKDRYNALCDPRQANNVVVAGQLLLLDLIEKLEPFCEIIQSNTDGVIVKMPSTRQPEPWFNLLDDVCYEWETRTHMKLEFDEYTEVYQKDVNNYIIVSADGSYKSKGAYVKKLSDLSYDLAVVNRAVVEYLIHKIPVERTIGECDSLRDFQKICHISHLYDHAIYDGERTNDKTMRVFASMNPSHGGVFKVKTPQGSPEKFANTPDHCFVQNADIRGVSVPKTLDKQWYIDLAKSRLRDFGVII